MFEKIRHLSTAIWITILLILSACATEQLSVVEELDELTAVTITYSRTPIILSIDEQSDLWEPREYLQIGAIEVNRMGTLQYFLWLGISEMKHTEFEAAHPRGFESIVFIAGAEEIQLDVLGWTHEAIGTSQRVYKKQFSTSVDAYYEVTLDQIQLLTEADGMKVRTSGSVPKEFVLWFRPIAAKDDLAEFLRTVLQ